MSTTVTMGVFTVTTVLTVGIERGIFADHGIDLRVEQVASSQSQFRDFEAGRLDLLQTAFDNVAHYGLNTTHALGRRLDVRAVLPLDWGMNLTLMSRPGISGLVDLRGRVLAVDSPSSGFAFVLYSILDGAGLSREDYQVVSHGGAAARLDRLVQGDADATLLSGGLEVAGAARGLTALATSADAVDPYLGGVVAVGASWAATHRDALLRFRSAYERSREVVTDPAESARVAIEIQSARGVSAATAAALLEHELGPLGIVRSSQVPREAALNTLRLRARYAGFDTDDDVEHHLGSAERGLVLET